MHFNQCFCLIMYPSLSVSCSTEDVTVVVFLYVQILQILAVLNFNKQSMIYKHVRIPTYTYFLSTVDLDRHERLNNNEKKLVLFQRSFRIVPLFQVTVETKLWFGVANYRQTIDKLVGDLHYFKLWYIQLWRSTNNQKWVGLGPTSRRRWPKCQSHC